LDENDKLAEKHPNTSIEPFKRLAGYRQSVMPNLHRHVEHGRQQISSCHVDDVVIHDGLGTRIIDDGTDEYTVAKYGDDQNGRVC